MIEITPLNDLANYLQRLVSGRLWLQVIIGMVLGAAVGIAINPNTGWIATERSEILAGWLDLPGTIFLRLVQMIMIPLIFTSIILGIVSNTSQNLKSFGLRLLLYFLFTSTVAIILAIVVANFFKPGEYIFEMGGLPSRTDPQPLDSGASLSVKNIPDSISQLIPNNPLEAILKGEMLGVVIFTVIIGVAITQLKYETSRPMIRFCESIQKICMIVVSWAMLLIPYAVFGLMAALLSKIGLEIFLGLGYYILVVILGLFVLIIFYLILVRFLGKQNPFTFLKAVREPQLLAFSTASSAAVMPLSMKAADNELKVASKVSDFVIPVGASINMDGTALFQCLTAIFMAQAYGIDLSMVNTILITVSVLAASIGTPAIPGGGVVVLASILQSSGIPTEGLLVIVGIDRILGMFRTAVNVTGDLTACVIFNRWYGSEN